MAQVNNLSKRFPIGKDMKISWLCWQYGHRRCRVETVNVNVMTNRCICECGCMNRISDSEMLCVMCKDGHRK